MNHPVEARGVVKRFCGKSVLADMSLTVREGSTTALLGRNGAGKSTFLLGSYVAFSRGRIHLGSRLRRAALAAGFFLLLAVPPAAAARVAAGNWCSLTPATEGLDYSVAIVDPTNVSVTDPSKEWFLVQASRRGKGPFRLPPPAANFAVRLKDGFARRLPPGMLEGPDTFRAGKGKIVLLKAQNVPGEHKVVLMDAVYDLAAGKVVSTRVRSPAKTSVTSFPMGVHRLAYVRYQRVEILKEGRPPIDLPKGRLPAEGSAPWGIVLRSWTPGESAARFSCFDLATERSQDLPSPPDGGRSVAKRGRAVRALANAALLPRGRSIQPA